MAQWGRCGPRGQRGGRSWGAHSRQERWEGGRNRAWRAIGPMGRPSYGAHRAQRAEGNVVRFIGRGAGRGWALVSFPAERNGGRCTRWDADGRDEARGTRRPLWDETCQGVNNEAPPCDLRGVRPRAHGGKAHTGSLRSRRFGQATPIWGVGSRLRFWCPHLGVARLHALWAKPRPVILRPESRLARPDVASSALVRVRFRCRRHGSAQRVVDKRRDAFLGIVLRARVAYRAQSKHEAPSSPRCVRCEDTLCDKTLDVLRGKRTVARLSHDGGGDVQGSGFGHGAPGANSNTGRVLPSGNTTSSV